MTGTKDLYPVSDTAALVMLWAGRYYAEKPLLGTYLRQLDLSAGQPLLDRYNGICPWYPEVIINRKHFIHSMVKERIRDRNKPTVIVNLGAGFSPLALELLPFLSDKVQFIEMDMRNMDRKRRMYADLVPDHSKYISCIEADIGDTGCLGETLAGQVDPEKTRLVVVMEGLTYYIGRPVMERVLGCLAGLARDQTLIFEHLKPCSLIDRERKFIPYEIFSHVRDYTEMDRMTTYSEQEIRTLVGPAFSCRYANMDIMEKQRTGINRYFPTPESGWLSCAVASRSSEEPDP